MGQFTGGRPEITSLVLRTVTRPTALRTSGTARDPDGTGAQAQVQIAVLSNKAVLALSDFIVI